MHKTNRKNTMTIISVVISLLIVAGLTYAWMSQRAAMTTLLSIEPPDLITIIPTTENGIEELHRAIWAIADDLRGAVDGWDFKNFDVSLENVR